MSRILRGVVSVIGSKTVNLLVHVAMTPILARILGSRQYGDYAFVVAVLSIATLFSDSGIFDGVRKFISEDRPVGNWETLVFSFYTQLGAVLSLITGLVVFSTGFFLVWAGMDPVFTSYFVLVAVLVGAKQLASIGRSTLMGLEYEHYSEALYSVQIVLFVILALSLASMGFGVRGVLTGEILATTAVGIVTLVVVSRHVSVSRAMSSVTNSVPRKELLTFNFQSVLLLLLITSLLQTDIILLRFLSGGQQTGYYKAALAAAEFLWFVPMAMANILIHSTSQLWHETDHDRINELASRTTRLTILLTVLLGIGLATVADVFIPLYFGQGFSAAVTPLLLLLPGAVSYGIARPIFAIGQGKGDLRILIYATAAAASINLVLNFTLIPRFGPEGAAIATSIGYSSMLVFHFWSAKQIGFNPAEELRLARIGVTAVVTTIILLGITTMLSGSILTLVIVPPVGFLVYSYLAISLGVIHEQELLTIVTALPKPAHRLVSWAVK